jgi:hypothetical protein
MLYEEDIFNWEQEKAKGKAENVALRSLTDFIVDGAMKGIFAETLPWDAATEALRLRKTAMGILFRWGSCWVGAHYSTKQKRLCVNLIPFVTIWVAFKGGFRP